MPIRMLLVEAVSDNTHGENNHPPLGLTYIASSLKREYGDEIELKIIKIFNIDEVSTFRPDIVGITSVTKNYNVAKKHARLAKQIFDLPVIIGGIHISLMPQTLTLDMDVGVAGEGEITIVELMASFIKNNGFDKAELAGIDGVIYREGIKLKVTKPRQFITDIDTIAYPARDLIEIDKHASMLTSRGCPFNCAFCSTSRYTGNRARYASAQYVADEIELIYRQYKVEYITIYDDLFVIDINRVSDIIDILREKGLLGKIQFAVNIRADFITEELAELLKRMNVAAVGLGIETGCQETLDYLKSGGITVEDNAKAIKILRKHKIRPYCVFILGSPCEDKAAMMQTVKFIKDNRVEFFDINILTPYPGTPVWDYAETRGLVSGDMDWSKLDFKLNSNPLLLSEKMSAEELVSVYELLERRKHRYQIKRRILKIIKHPDIYIKAYIRAVIERIECH